jgi:hypothetical protein
MKFERFITEKRPWETASVSIITPRPSARAAIAATTTDAAAARIIAATSPSATATPSWDVAATV